MNRFLILFILALVVAAPNCAIQDQTGSEKTGAEVADNGNTDDTSQDPTNSDNDGTTDGTDNSGDGGGGDTTATSPRILAQDASGTELGKVTSAYGSVLTISTSTGHFVTLSWEGNISDTVLYFQSTDCTGAPHVSSDKSLRQTAYQYQGTIYDFKTLDASGLATPVTKTLNSDYYTTCSDNSGFAAPADYVELKATTMTGIGLPATIQSPVTLVFE